MKLTLASLALSVCAFAAGVARAELAPACNPAATDRNLREHGFVRLGGIEQWVVIDGADCANPVVLFVHGGPGNPLSPHLEELFGAWRGSFTLVTWDQRLSGRTFARNEPVVELTEERLAATSLDIGRLVADGLELTDYLRERLGKRKIVLTGTSWGSVLGVHMAHARPEAFHAYVGVSQLVEHRANAIASYEAVRERATQKGDDATLSLLKELGPPPWTHPRSFGKVRRVIRVYEAERTGPAPSYAIPPEYASDADRAAYFAGEELSFVKYVGLEGDGIAVAVDLPALGGKFQLPMYIVQGEEDLLTRPEVTREWFAALDAPRKRLVMVAQAGHDPNFALIDAQFRILKDEVLPLTR